MRIYKLKSDNYDDYVTARALKEIKLQMSSGDYGTHTHKLVSLDKIGKRRVVIDYRRKSGTWIDLKKDKSNKLKVVKKFRQYQDPCPTCFQSVAVYEEVA